MPPIYRRGLIPRTSAASTPTLEEALEQLKRLVTGAADPPAPLSPLPSGVPEGVPLRGMEALEGGRYRALYQPEDSPLPIGVDFTSETPIETQPLLPARDRLTAIGNILGITEDDLATRQLSPEDLARQHAMDVRDSRTTLSPFQDEYGNTSHTIKRTFKQAGAEQWTRAEGGNSVEKQRRKGTTGRDILAEEEDPIALAEPARVLGPGGRPLADQTSKRLQAFRWALDQADTQVRGHEVYFRHPDGRPVRLIARTPEERALLEAADAAGQHRTGDFDIGRRLDDLEAQGRKLVRGDEALLLPGAPADELAGLDAGTLTALRTTLDAPEVRFWHPSGETRDVPLEEGLPLSMANAGARLGLTPQAARFEREAALTPGGELAKVRPVKGSGSIPPLEAPALRKRPLGIQRPEEEIPPLPGGGTARHLVFREHFGKSDPEGGFTSAAGEDPAEGIFIEGFGKAFSTDPEGFQLTSYAGGTGDTAGAFPKTSRGARGRGIADKRALAQADAVVVYGVKRDEGGRVLIPPKGSPGYWLAQTARAAERMGKPVYYNENAEGLASVLKGVAPGARVYMAGRFDSLGREVVEGFAARAQRLTRIPMGSDQEASRSLRQLSKVARAIGRITKDKAAMKAVAAYIDEHAAELTVVKPFALADGSIVFATDAEGRQLAVQSRPEVMKGSRGNAAVKWGLPQVSARELADGPGEALDGIKLPARFQRVAPQELPDGWTLLGVDPTSGLGAGVSPRPDGSGLRLSTSLHLGGKYPDLALQPLHGNRIIRLENGGQVQELTPGQAVTLPGGRQGTVVSPVARQVMPGQPIASKTLGPDGKPRIFPGPPDRVDVGQVPVVQGGWNPAVHSVENTFFVGTPDEAAAMGIPPGVHQVATLDEAKRLMLGMNARELRGAMLPGQYGDDTLFPSVPGVDGLRNGPMRTASQVDPVRLPDGSLAPAGQALSRTPADSFGYHIVAGPSVRASVEEAFPGMSSVHLAPLTPEDPIASLVSVHMDSPQRVSPAVLEMRRLAAQLEATTDPATRQQLEAALVVAENARKAELAGQGVMTQREVPTKGGGLTTRLGRVTQGRDPGQTFLVPRGDLTPGERPQLRSAPIDRTPPTEGIGPLGAPSPIEPVTLPDGRVISPSEGALADTASEALLVRQLMDELGIDASEARQRLDAERPALGRQFRMAKEDGLPTAQGPRDFGATSDLEGLKAWITQMAANGALGSRYAEGVLSKLLAFSRGELIMPGEETLLNSIEGPPFAVPQDQIMDAVAKGRAWAASPAGQQWKAETLAKASGRNVSIRDASAVETENPLDRSTREDVLKWFQRIGLGAAATVLGEEFLGDNNAEAAPVPKAAVVAAIQNAEVPKTHPLGPAHRALQVLNSTYQPLEATMAQPQVNEFRRRMGMGMGNADAGLRPVVSAREAWDRETGAPELLTEALNLLRRQQVFSLAHRQEADLQRQLRALPNDAPEGQLNDLLSRLNDVQQRIAVGEVSPWGATERELAASAEAELMGKDGGAEALAYARDIVQPKVQEAIAEPLRELYGPARAQEMLAEFWLPLDKQLAWDVEAGGPRSALAGASPRLPPENLDMPSATSVHGFSGSIDELAEPWKAIEHRIHRIWTEYSSNEASKYATAHLTGLGIARPVPPGQRPPDLGPGWMPVSNIVQGERQQFMVPQIFGEVLREDRRGILAVLQHVADAVGASFLGKTKGTLSTAMTGASVPFMVGQVAIDLPAAMLLPRYRQGVKPLQFLRDYLGLFAEEFRYAWDKTLPYSPEAEEFRRTGAGLGGWSGLYQNTGAAGSAPDNLIVNTLLKPVADYATSPHEHAMKRAAFRQLRRQEPSMPREVHAGDVRANAGTPDLAVKSGLTKVDGVETLTNFVNAQTRVVEQGLRALVDPTMTPTRLKQVGSTLFLSMVALPLWNRWAMGDEEYQRMERQPGTLALAVPGTEEQLSDGRIRPMVIRMQVPKMLELAMTAFEEPLQAAFGGQSWTQAVLDMAESVLPGQADLKDTAIGASFADRAVSTLQPLTRYPAEVYGTGRRSLTGAPIESDLVMRRLPGDRVNVSTGATAKGLGRMAGVSPIRLQHAIDTLLPGTLGMPVHAMDKAFAPEGSFGESLQEQLYSSNPVTRRFLLSPFNAESEQTRDRFGALYQQMEQAAVSARLPDPADPEEIRWLLRFKPQFDALQARMAREIRREREIVDTPGVPQAARARRAAQVGARQRAILDDMQRAMAVYEAARAKAQ